MQKSHLIQYIKGTLHPEDKKAVIEWIREDVAHQKEFNLLKANYIASTIGTLDDINIDEPFHTVLSKRKKKKKNYYVAVVVMLLILPTLGWYFSSSSSNTLIADVSNLFNFNTEIIHTEYGDHKTIKLPDGSIAILNSGSQLEYPKTFNDTIRAVTLTGEAFFDVKKDSSKPFIVTTETLKIKVLGTSFNIKSYPKDENIETTLVSGKVEVHEQKNKAPVTLLPSQRAIFNKTQNKIEVDQVDSQKIVAWRQGKLIFDKTPLKDVVSDLSRKYDIQFVIKSDSLLQYKYTGEFDNLSLEEVLEVLKISSPINYKHINNKIMLNSE